MAPFGETLHHVVAVPTAAVAEEDEAHESPCAEGVELPVRPSPIAMTRKPLARIAPATATQERRPGPDHPSPLTC
jgi:hypothetical protein